MALHRCTQCTHLRVILPVLTDDAFARALYEAMAGSMMARRAQAAAAHLAWQHLPSDVQAGWRAAARVARELV